jgi:hypothetical protein
MSYSPAHMLAAVFIGVFSWGLLIKYLEWTARCIYRLRAERRAALERIKRETECTTT